MRPQSLDYLACPDCQVELACQVYAESEGDIDAGVLRCPVCSAGYPILRGIPRFVTTEQPLQGRNHETMGAFGCNGRSSPS